MRLETERFILRQPGPQDIDAGVDFYMSERAQYAGGNKDLGGAWRAVAMVMGHWTIRGFGLWIVTSKDSDAALGAVGPWYPGNWPETELGWTLWSADTEGQGIAHEAVTAARRDVYSRLGWTSAVSYIAPANTRSIALAERLGATLDETAARPDDTCLVYRHPPAEACA